MAVPVVVGVGDIKNRSTKVEDAVEPMNLMLQAIQKAISDTGLAASSAQKLQSSIDSLDVVRSWTWPYTDLPSLLSERLEIDPTRKYYSEHGGNSPGKWFDEAARRISRGETQVAVLTGGEALASLTACAAVKKLPPPNWTAPDQPVTEVFTATGRDRGDSTSFSLNFFVDDAGMQMSSTDLGAQHSINDPIQVYPLYENGLRAHLGQTIQENWDESAQMYAEFAAVAEKNEYAWDFGKKRTKDDVGTLSTKNRMICFPYPLLQNAFNTVNLAAAVILTSTEHAEELGIPRDRWIYALGGAGTEDSHDFWERQNYHTAPCISRSLDAALQVSNMTKEEIDYYDFYSCFPIVPKLACRHLGLCVTNPSKPITLLGGLTSFGGAGNNYSMHAITALTRLLRQQSNHKTRKSGLILANGGLATYQHAIILSSHKSPSIPNYPPTPPLPPSFPSDRSPTIAFFLSSTPIRAKIETYTVSYTRDNLPAQGFIVGRVTDTNARFLANHGDDDTLRQLASMSQEPIGRAGWVWSVGDEKREKKRNVFSFELGEFSGKKEGRVGARL